MCLAYWSFAQLGCLLNLNKKKLAFITFYSSFYDRLDSPSSLQLQFVIQCKDHKCVGWQCLLWVCYIAWASRGYRCTFSLVWHSWVSNIMVTASGETYVRSYWTLEGRLKLVTVLCQSRSAVETWVFLLCSVICCRPEGCTLWGRWFELSCPSDSSPLHLMLLKLQYGKNRKWSLMHDSLVILDTSMPSRCLITSVVKLFGEHVQVWPSLS